MLTTFATILTGGRLGAASPALLAQIKPRATVSQAGGNAPVLVLRGAA